MLACVCLGAGTAYAETWDVKQALALAVELEDTLSQTLAAAQEAPAQDTAMQGRTRDAAVSEMKRVHWASRELVTRLQVGGDREGTEPFFFRVRDNYKAAIQTARNAVAQPTVGPLLDKVESLMLSLQKLYEAG